MSTDPGAPRRRYAIITPSHALDFERCRALVESVRRHAGGLGHYVLVEHRSEPLFASLRGEECTSNPRNAGERRVSAGISSTSPRAKASSRPAVADAE